MSTESSELSEFIEKFEAWLEEAGLPRIPARVLTHLMVCDPPQQSAEELATAVRASTGSISSATQLLVRTNLVQRSGRRGERRSYYEVAPDAWQFLIDRQLAQLASLRALTAQGTAALRPAGSERAERMADLDELARFLLEEWGGLRARWHERHDGRSRPVGTTTPPTTAPPTTAPQPTDRQPTPEETS